MGNRELRKEFKIANGNVKAWGFLQSHVPRYYNAYVEWLEELVIRLRTRPDLQLHDEPHWPADV